MHSYARRTGSAARRSTRRNNAVPQRLLFGTEPDRIVRRGPDLVSDSQLPVVAERVRTASMDLELVCFTERGHQVTFRRATSNPNCVVIEGITDYIVEYQPSNAGSDEGNLTVREL